MPDQPSTVLQRTLASVNPRTIAPSSELRRQLCDFVDAAKARDEPLGRIVFELHEIFLAAGAIALTKPEGLLDVATRICIEYYYGVGRHWH